MITLWGAVKGLMMITGFIVWAIGLVIGAVLLFGPKEFM